MSAGTAHNLYGRQLSEEEIASGAHRDFVGGLWNEMGSLQFEFMLKQGLQPKHRFLDLGCGALRGGVHFVRYLDPGCYHGLDVNLSLLEAGRRELAVAGLAERAVQLLPDGNFDADRFGVKFEHVLAVSVFTHLPFNVIVRALCRVSKVLAPGGAFHASVFLAPGPACLDPQTHEPGGVVTHYDQDPYHASAGEFEWMASLAGLAMDVVGDWGHPRGQQMLVFRVPG